LTDQIYSLFPFSHFFIFFIKKALARFIRQGFSLQPVSKRHPVVPWPIA
jgi:hypothetical protein